MAIDPLRSVRDSIQLVSPTAGGGDLLICGMGPAQEIVWARAKALARGGTRVVVAELSSNASSTIALSEATGNWPQRLEFATRFGEAGAPSRPYQKPGIRENRN